MEVKTENVGKKISKKKNRAMADANSAKNKMVHVSNTKKPFVFYLNLAKRWVVKYNKIELSAMGMAIPTAVTIAETLKRDGLAIQKEIMISTVLCAKEIKKGRWVDKPKIEIVMERADNPVGNVATDGNNICSEQVEMLVKFVEKLETPVRTVAPDWNKADCEKVEMIKVTEELEKCSAPIVTASNKAAHEVEKVMEMAKKLENTTVILAAA